MLHQEKLESPAITATFEPKILCKWQYHLCKYVTMSLFQFLDILFLREVECTESDLYYN